MADPLILDLKQLSRRDFLRITGTSLLSILLLPVSIEQSPKELPDQPPVLQGRILGNEVKLYDRPSFSGKMVNIYYKDVVMPITRITIGDAIPEYNRIWYEMNGAGYMHSGNVQPVDIRTNPIIHEIPEAGALAEITVPFTDAVWDCHRPENKAYRLYYGTTHWISGIAKDYKGNFWYSFPDDKWGFTYYANPTHFHFVTQSEQSPISANVDADDKRLEVNLSKQVVIAYEQEKPVFMARTATGARFSDGDFSTPTGKYMTNRKRPSRHMAAGDPAAPSSYDLPGVPWISYLTKMGISFHGTYWHNDFGKPRSHGCLNLSIPAARWIYRWSLPSVPAGQVFWDEDSGTAVDVLP
jgi:lipoprotein-anchoring transpeptidase ErfK/SrfK